MAKTTAVNVQSIISFVALFFLLVILSLLITIKHIQDFFCLIVHQMKVNKSLHILVISAPIIPITIEITNIWPKLKEFVYVM